MSNGVNARKEESSMRVHVLIGPLIIAACAISIGRAAEEKEQSNFRMVVTFDKAKNEVALKCTVGCAWTDLTFGCGEDKQCSSAIDAGGMTD